MEKLELILKTLRRELEDGRYAHLAHFPSEYELSERFGVNKKTANKAVSLLVAGGLLVRGTRGQGTRVVSGLLFHREQIAFIGELTSPYYANVFHGIQNAAMSRRYLVTYLSPSGRIADVLKMLSHSPVKGIVTHAYGRLETAGIPVVYIDHELQAGEQDLHTISCNNYQGGYEIMREVIARGHRDIVIYFHPALMRERLTGFYRAMSEAGIEDCEERTFYSMEHSDFDAKSALKRIQRKYPHFTALATGSDNDLLRMAKAMSGAGIVWSGRKALTGFGNVTGIGDTLPVATVDQHPFRIGCRAAEILIDMMENGEPEQPVRDMLDVEILYPHHIPVLC